MRGYLRGDSCLSVCCTSHSLPQTITLAFTMQMLWGQTGPPPNRQLSFKWQNVCVDNRSYSRMAGNHWSMNRAFGWIQSKHKAKFSYDWVVSVKSQFYKIIILSQSCWKRNYCCCCFCYRIQLHSLFHIILWWPKWHTLSCLISLVWVRIPNCCIYLLQLLWACFSTHSAESERTHHVSTFTLFHIIGSAVRISLIV